MTKKGKTTLKDLDQFLKQQPNTLVDVEKVEGERSSETDTISESEPLTESDLVDLITGYAENAGKPLSQVLYEIITLSLNEKSAQTPSELMLLNTVNYLAHADALTAQLKQD